jgi:hypothetical protein
MIMKAEYIIPYPHTTTLKIASLLGVENSSRRLIFECLKSHIMYFKSYFHMHEMVLILLVKVEFE